MDASEIGAKILELIQGRFIGLVGVIAILAIAIIFQKTRGD